MMWVCAMRCPMIYRHCEDSELLGAYSADGGRSWNPVELAMAYTMPLIYLTGPYCVTENGSPGYLFPMHRIKRRRDPRGSSERFIFSNMKLMEWSFAAYVPQPVAGSKVILHKHNINPGDA